MNNVHFSSETDLWSTPDDFYQKYNKIFNFGLDVCANKENSKCNNYFTEEQNGLLQDWSGYGNIWCNPPYGRGIGKWLQKAYECNELVVMLVPARTDTKWWHDYATNGHITFIKGRLKFGNSKENAPFPNAIIIFGMPK